MSVVRRFKDFARSTSGNVVIIFGLALVPLAGMTGAAIDYSRGNTIKNQLQSAADAAALAATRNYGKSWSERQQIAQASFEANTAGLPIGQSANFVITDEGNYHRVVITASMQTSFMELLGIPTIDIAADAEAISPNANLEVVLVLDNTGSMKSQNKIGILRDSAENFVDLMETAAAIPGKEVKISLVPFSTVVRLDADDYKDEFWVDMGSQDPDDWTGCLWDRHYPYDSNDTVPTLSDSDTLFDPDGSSGFKSSKCKIAESVPLTKNYNLLRDRIDDMKAKGYTDIALGVVWGLHMLSPTLPMTEGASFSDAETTKAMIILTDGDNTRSRWSNNQSVIDTRTRFACDSVKSAGVDVVYTVRVVNGNETLLQECASAPENYRDIQAASDLEGTFEEMATDLINRHLRLTM